MTTGPITTFSNASLDRRATITMHDTIKPKKRKAHVSKPGTYAAPKHPDAAAPRTIPFSGDLDPTPHQPVRAGGDDFLKCPSKGFSC